LIFVWKSRRKNAAIKGLLCKPWKVPEGAGKIRDLFGLLGKPLKIESPGILLMSSKSNWP